MESILPTPMTSKAREGGGWTNGTVLGHFYSTEIFVHVSELSFMTEFEKMCFNAVHLF